LSNLSWQKTHIKELLWLMIIKHQPNCYLCDKPFSLKLDFPKRMTDLITDHHIDGDHMNMTPSNRVLVHRSCHKSHHTKDNLHARYRL